MGRTGVEAELREAYRSVMLGHGDPVSGRLVLCDLLTQTKVFSAFHPSEIACDSAKREIGLYLLAMLGLAPSNDGEDIFQSLDSLVRLMAQNKKNVKALRGEVDE